MFLAIISVLIINSPYFVWQFGIRPYCLRNGKGYTPGANFATTMWVDWQEAREMAAVRGEKGPKIACQLFLGIHLVFYLGLLAVVFIGVVFLR